jgi:hypothetical protein
VSLLEVPEKKRLVHVTDLNYRKGELLRLLALECFSPGVMIAVHWF